MFENGQRMNLTTDHLNMVGFLLQSFKRHNANHFSDFIDFNNSHSQISKYSTCCCVQSRDIQRSNNKFKCLDN
ncbi:CLUMA_CG014985, isoform A [Clunio marinus]|uniref:CLUMA_CG014985, isoform A n=1 Tax=Clunio marinus TaxID=568069 RepID=A0A1J1ITD4_9DIPT|nr:CLUMA_CG014985, isoform A [Clunio marinus]